MLRTLALIYGAFSYAVFFVTFLYAVGFVGNLFVPKSIDSGGPVSFAQAVLVNTLLLGIFAVQHSVMARPAFKRWWTQWIPQPVERSTYVLLSSLALILLFWQWRPLPDVVWNADNDVTQLILWALYAAGWIIVLISTFLIGHFDLFGLRQVWLYLRRKEYTESEFVMPFFYKLVRHPIMLGFVIAFWATPRMTVGHLFFAIATTGYIVVALHFEERDLVRAHGAAYEHYRKQVPMLFPFKRRTSRKSAKTAEMKHEQ